ncbi:MAG: sigma-70 domain-containing protein [Eubacteriales bacterium]|nr:sigma-70 domain-containing protein [Eubacteriales bacterium]
MREEEVFSQTLQSICSLAKEQGNLVSEEQVQSAFSEAGMELGKEQLSMVHEYLKTKKIGIGEPVDPFDYLSEEETDYLNSYLEELERLPETTEGEKEAITLSAMAGDYDAKQRLIEIFLPQVVEIAKLYAGQGAFLEDLIGEGNVSLAMAVEMLDCAENVTAAHGTIASMIMEAMETYIEENVQQKKTGEKMAGKANDVLEKARELAEELGRKVTIQELADETQMSPAQIREAVRITADNIDYLDTKDIH